MRGVLLTALLAITGTTAGAQRAATAGSPPAPGATLVISLLTFGPGDAVWERFGHNAIRVRDTATGSDLSYNWGMFSFDQPNFIGRFLSGDTRYWVDAFPTQTLLEYYVRNDRESIEQVLALTPAQRLEIATFVVENVKEENKYYRYDYFRDNCSTRVRDVLDRVLGGSLQRRFSVATTSFTYRDETIRLLTPDPLPQAGVDFALGPRADRPLSAWEAMFVPMRVRDYLREVTIGADTGTIPLVSEERVLHQSQRAVEPVARRRLALIGWAWILAVWIGLLTPTSPKARRWTRSAHAVIGAGWLLFTGLLGTILLLMWIGSAHVFWYNNLNLLVVSPLGLVAAGPYALAIHRGQLTLRMRWLLVVVLAQPALALLLASVASQHLGGPLQMILPVQAMLALALTLHLRVAREARPGAGVA